MEISSLSPKEIRDGIMAYEGAAARLKAKRAEKEAARMAAVRAAYAKRLLNFQKPDTFVRVAIEKMKPVAQELARTIK